MRFTTRYAIYLLLLVLLGAMNLFLSCRQEPQQAQPPILVNGAYLIQKSNENKEALEPIPSDQVVVVHNHKYSNPDDHEPPVFIRVHRVPDVPLWLESPPVLGLEQSTGKTFLQITLNQDAGPMLEEFTSVHQGGNSPVAVIIGGEVVTAHKIRTAIRGGQLQVVCCSKGACEYLAQRLSSAHQ